MQSRERWIFWDQRAKLQIVLSLHDCCMLTALCRPHSTAGSVRGGGARRTATLTLVAVWRPVRGGSYRGAARAEDIS